MSLIKHALSDMNNDWPEVRDVALSMVMVVLMPADVLRHRCSPVLHEAAERGHRRRDPPRAGVSAVRGHGAPSDNPIMNFYQKMGCGPRDVFGTLVASFMRWEVCRGLPGIRRIVSAVVTQTPSSCRGNWPRPWGGSEATRRWA